MHRLSVSYCRMTAVALGSLMLCLIFIMSLKILPLYAEDRDMANLLDHSSSSWANVCKKSNQSPTPNASCMHRDPVVNFSTAQNTITATRIQQTILSDTDLVPVELIVEPSVGLTTATSVVFSVTLQNIGAETIPPNFWVDLYINPQDPPEQAGDVWQNRCTSSPCLGLSWQVGTSIDPDQMLTLSSQASDPHLSSDLTEWDGFFATGGTKELWVFVDSWGGSDDPDGFITESDEFNNRFGPVQVEVAPQPACIGVELSLPQGSLIPPEGADITATINARNSDQFRIVDANGAVVAGPSASNVLTFPAMPGITYKGEVRSTTYSWTTTVRCEFAYRETLPADLNVTVFLPIK